MNYNNKIQPIGICFITLSDYLKNITKGRTITESFKIKIQNSTDDDAFMDVLLNISAKSLRKKTRVIPIGNYRQYTSERNPKKDWLAYYANILKSSISKSHINSTTTKGSKSKSRLNRFIKLDNNDDIKFYARKNGSPSRNRYKPNSTISSDRMTKSELDDLKKASPILNYLKEQFKKNHDRNIFTIDYVYYLYIIEI